MRPALRRLWLKLHRWIGLSLGLVLALVALTGASLVVLKPLDRALHPGLFRAPAPGAPAAPLEAVRAELVARYGEAASFTLRPPRAPDETFWAYVHGDWSGIAYLDPASARWLGQRGEVEGLANLLFEMHSTLLLGDAGRPLMALLALVYLVLLASGMVLWWPLQWGRAWRVEWRGGGTRALFDLHRAGGSLLGLLVAVSVATGAYMAWRPLAGWVTVLAGEQPVVPPRLPGATLEAIRGPIALDRLVQTAQARYPAGRIGYIQLPSGGRAPVRVRLKLPDDPHPNGLTSVWLHPASGNVLAAYRWDELDAGGRATATIYPLHTGALGGGLHEAANAVLGVTLFGLGASGAWVWWRRRRLRAGR